MKYLSRLSGKIVSFFGSKAGAITGLLVSIGAFLALTLTRLTSSSIWFDESYSAYLMRFNWSDLTHYTAVDVHPPLYYYLLKIWTTLFGTTPAALRSMSVLFGVIALILAFILIKKMFSQKTALLSTFLIAISPMFVRYGIEARMYMVVTCIVLMALIAFLKASKSDRLRDWLLYGLLVCLGMYTHYFTAVVWLSPWIYRIITLRRQGLHGKKLVRNLFGRNWTIAHLLAIGLYLPWLPIAYHQFSSLTGGNGFWIPPITMNTPGDLWSDITIYLEGWRPNGWTTMLLLALLAIVIALLINSYRHGNSKYRQSLTFVVTLAVCPVISLALLSCYPLKSTFVDRYLMPSVILIVALIGIGIASSKRRKLAAIGLIATLICFSYGIYNVYHYGNYNRYGGGPDKVTLTGELVNQIKQLSPNGEPIIAAMSYGYYESAVYEDDKHPVYFIYDTVKDDLTGSLQMQRDNKLGKGITNLSQFTKEHPRVWRIGSNSEDKIAAPDGTTGWHAIRTITATDPISGVHNYKATEYEIK